MNCIHSIIIITIIFTLMKYTFCYNNVYMYVSVYICMNVYACMYDMLHICMCMHVHIFILLLIKL